MWYFEETNSEKTYKLFIMREIVNLLINNQLLVLDHLKSKLMNFVQSI